MKKLKLFFACLLMAVLSIGQVWGDSYTITLKSSTGTGDSSSGMTSTTVADYVADGASYVSAVAPSGKVYLAKSDCGIKFGNSSGGGSLTFTLATAVKPTSIVVNASQYGASEGKGIFQGEEFDMTGGGGKYVFNNYTVEYDGNTSVTTISVGAEKRGYVKSITVNYGGTTPPPSCTNEITITKADDPANGTFVLDNSGTVCIDEGNATVTVTASPADHYHLATVTSTAGTIGTISGNTCEITDIDADTEIGVTFAEDTKYVVTWNVNGNEDTKTNVYAGEKPVFPATPDACDATSTTFIGWATAPWTGKLADLSEKTVYTSASAMPDVDAAVTYYAVFAKSSGSASELFSWAGGTKAELEAAEGVAALNADNSDYAESNAPYRVKWNGTGKYIIISVASQPGKVSAGFKMIGGATTSTITVQEADDAEGPFTDVENLAISGSTNDEVNIESTQAFKSTTRAIKLYYTKGSNVGLGPISIESAVSMSDYMTTCCTQYNVNIAAGIENGSVSADVAKACEGATVTLTFTPAGGYHLDSWSLNGTAQDIAVNTFSMPAAAATVSATFAHDDCANLAAPTLDEITKSYNSATIAWNTVTDAVAYAVSVVNHATSASIFAGNVDALSKALADLDPETQYDYSIMAVGDGSVKCADGNGVLEGNFTTDALPTAHLTLIDPSGTHASSGDYAILTPFNLPPTAAACSKEFRGWDSDENCATAPTYAKGAEFSFANTTGVTLYAVYADELTPGTTSYVKTALADIASGSEVVVTETKGDDMWALSYNPSTSKTVAAAVSEAENILDVSSLTTGFWTLSKDGDNFTLTVVGGTDKLYCNNTNDGVRVGSGDANTFSINNNYLYTSATSDARYLGAYNGTDFRCYTSINSNITGQTLAFYKKVTSEGTYGNYSTTCAASPTATPASNLIEVAAAGGSSTLGVTYENVNLAAVAVALYNNEACTEAFDGDWLTASIAGDDKHIAYTATENTSYNDARTAYIKLTAPETSAAADPAVVVIPVSQAKKAAVFASLQELVAADVNANTNVTVSFENVVIKEIYMYNSNRRGLVFNIQKDAQDIKIYFNADVPAAWTAGGKVSGTLTNCPWKIYSGAWQLAPADGFAWATDLSYTAPKAVSSVVVSGAPTKDTYVDGEKFNPAGLTVTVNYNDATSEVNPTGVTFACTPVRVAKSDDPVSVSVVATFNEIDSDPFEVTGLTVGDIQTKTVAQFIEAGNADMRCYLEGIVSDIETGTKLKYGNFNLTDASGTIYVYGCLNQAGEAEHFEDLDVHNGDKIKVLAEDYEYYNSKNEAKNVQFVSKTPAATISIDNIDMETGDELALSSIVATITPAAAQSATISYEVTEGAAVSISEGKIIAEAAGEATITASIAEGVGYLAGNTTFTVTVTAPDNRKIATASAFTATSGDMSPADISFAAYQGDATNAPVVRSGDNPVTIRMYKAATGKSTGGYLTLKAKVGCTIDQVKIEFSGNADAAYCKDAEALPTSKYITGQAELLTPTGLNAQSVSIVNLKNGSIDVAAITVWYNGDPLAVHHYILGGTYTTVFEQYGTFSYEGLTVTAAYDEQETITEPVSGFTAEADLMTAGNKKAEVYLDLVKIGEYDITVNAAAKENPALAYDPIEETIAAENIASWSAPAFSNTFNVSPITYNSDKPAVATVDENGIITLAGGYGTAVITASFAEDDEYIASVATYTITVNEPAEDLSGVWVVATSVAAGDRIIIANVASQGAVKTMGAQNGNYRDQVASTVDGDGKLTPADGTKVFTLIDASTIDANYTGFALRATNGNYLSAASGSSNNIKEVASVDDANAVWSIEISEGVAAIVAQGSYTRNVIRYNNSQPRFSCYAANNSMDDVVIYKIQEDTPEPQYTTVRTGLTAGNYYTVCWPKAMTAIKGGTLWSFAGKDAAMAYLIQEDAPFEAGKPYIIYATAEKLEAVVEGDDAPAGSNNGLYGTLSYMDDDALAAAGATYMLKSNALRPIGTNNHLDANRAYVILDQITGGEPANVPAHKVRKMPMQDQTTTDCELINAAEAPAKMMIDGQLFILRGEKMYDTTGRLVK